MLPLIAKTEGDRKRLLMKEAFESIVRMAGKHAEHIANEDVCESGVVVTGRERKVKKLILMFAASAMLVFSVECAGARAQAPEPVYYADA